MTQHPLFFSIRPCWCYYICLSHFLPLLSPREWTRVTVGFGLHRDHLWRDSRLMIFSWDGPLIQISFHFQVGQEKGNCSFQKNPTPCIIPQEQENIFHTIFAFFTKSGRKVLVRICLLVGFTWVVLTRKASLRWEASFLFGMISQIWFESIGLESHKDYSQLLFFQPEVSIKVLNLHFRFHWLAKGKPLQPTKYKVIHFSQ